ncbi:hypothetical protein ACWCHM_22255 [Micromonospora sp. SCSIO 07396]
MLPLGPSRDTGLHLRDGDLLLVAGGTGLAPLRAPVEQVAAAPSVAGVPADRIHLPERIRRQTPERKGHLHKRLSDNPAVRSPS